MVFRILRNIISLLTGHVVSKVFSLICVIFLARQLGVEGFGMYGAAMAYLTLFAVIAESGMATVATRDIAQDYSRSEEVFSHVLALRMLLTALSYGIMLLCGKIWGGSEYSLKFIMIYALFLFPEAIRRLSASMLSAYERMDIVAGLNVVSTLFRYIPFLLAILLGRSLQEAFVFLLISWIGIALLWLFVTKHVCLTQWITHLHTQKLWAIFRESLPFGVLTILSIIYFKVDILMLSSMQGSTAVGYYEGAYKFIEASMFIPTSFIHVLLPVMARTFTADKSSYRNIYVHSTRILAIGILPVVIGVSFFAKELILVVYDNTYLPSATALSLLIWTLFVSFLNAPVGNIIATSKQMHKFLPYAIANTLLNIVLNLILIPHYSFLGASFTTVFTECTGFMIQLWFAHRILGNGFLILGVLGKLSIAGIITSVVCYTTKSLLPVPLTLLAILGSYIMSIMLLKVFDHHDKRICLEVIRMVKMKFV